MDLHDYQRVIAKHWLVIVVSTVVVAALAGVYTFLQPRIYTAQAYTFVAIGSSSSQTDAATDATYTIQRISSYIQLVESDSPDVLQPVIDNLGLKVSVEQLGRTVSAGNPTGTVLIGISAENEDPERAATIANAVAVQLGTVIQRLETSISGSIVPVKATLTTPAKPPSSPSSPKVAVNLLLALILGLALGLGLAALREALDTSVMSPDELVKLTGANPLGMIAYDSEAKDRPLVALDQRGPRSEVYRAIRTNLQYVDVDHPPQVVAITSAVPAEGKSTLAVNLAITMAQMGRTVVIVETDLRRPNISNYLGIDTGLGLTDVLAGQASLDEALMAWNRGMLTVLPSGHIPPNPSELLASHQFEQVLDSLRQRYDSVIVDCTPLLPVTDGAIVAKAADGAVLVVRSGKTTRQQVQMSVAALNTIGARLLGTTLNFAPTGRRGYGYSYGYAGSYESLSNGESVSQAKGPKQKGSPPASTARSQAPVDELARPGGTDVEDDAVIT